MHYIKNLIIITSITFCSSNLLSMTELPLEIQKEILFNTVHPDAAHLGRVAGASKSWNAIVTDISFVNRCESMNIRMKPVLIVHDANSNESYALDLLKNGIKSHNDMIQQKKRSISHSKIEELNNYVPFQYIDPEKLSTTDSHKGILWHSGRPFVGLLVNPNVTTVYNRFFNCNPTWNEQTRLAHYEKSKITLSQFLVKKKKEKELLLQKDEFVLLNPLTAEPEVHNTPAHSIHDYYTNIIHRKSPVADTKLIQDTTPLALKKSAPTQYRSSRRFDENNM